MSISSRPAAFLTIFTVLCQGQAPPGLKVTVEEGAGAVVARGAFSSRSYVVRVTGVERQAAGGATVTFSLPEQGASGTFLSGFRREMVLTGVDGRAEARGILWGPEAGKVELRVAASMGGARAEAVIPIEVSATERAAEKDRAGVAAGGRGGGRKWLILAAVAGGALAGVAVAGQGSGKAAPAAAVGPVVTPPAIGAPSITVGRPQ